MPNSGVMADNPAKVVADAVIARLTGQPINESPIIANSCCRFVSTDPVVHVAGVPKWNTEQKTLVAATCAGELSAQRNGFEAQYAVGWGRSTWAAALA